MSKATNNTQRVTFGKPEGTNGWETTRTILLDGHIVGALNKGCLGVGYDVRLHMAAEGNSYNKSFDMGHDGIRAEHWSVSFGKAKAYVIEMLAKAEIVRTHERPSGEGVTGFLEITEPTEEPAQAETNDYSESVALECPVCDRIVATVTPANVGPSSYARTCKCGRRTRHDVTLTITQDERIRVARWGMVATNMGTASRQWVKQAGGGMEYETVFVPAQVEAVEVQIPAFKGSAVVPVMADGVKVGHITQEQREIYAGVAGYRVTVGDARRLFFETARAAKAAAEEMAIAHCAQADA